MKKLILLCCAMFSLSASASAQQFSHHIPKDLGNIFIHRVPKNKGGIRGVLKPRPIFPEDEIKGERGMDGMESFSEVVRVLHEEVLPYERMKEEDPNLPEGETKLKQEGKAGHFKVRGIYLVSDLTGKEELMNKVEDVVKPTPEIVIYGTKKQQQASTDTFDILEVGTIPPKIIRQGDYHVGVEYFPGLPTAKNQLYKVSSGSYGYSGFEQYALDNRLYIVESLTPTGRLFSELKVGDFVELEGQTYQVKALEFPTTAQRDRFVPPFKNITPYQSYYGEGDVINYGHSNVLEHHLDFLISTIYNSPTSKMIQVCVDSRMVQPDQWQVNADRFTNKIIVLDLLDSPIPQGVGNVYPFIGWDYVVPVYEGLSYF